MTTPMNEKARWRVTYALIAILAAGQGAQYVMPTARPDAYTQQMATVDKAHLARELQHITDAALLLTSKFEDHLTLAMHHGAALVVEKMRADLIHIRAMLVEIRDRLKPK